MDSEDSPTTQELLMDEPVESHRFLLEPLVSQDSPVLTSSPSSKNQAKNPKEFNPKDQGPPPPPKAQLKAKNWFLTFPQTETTKEEALNRLKDKHKEDLRGCLIAQEAHQDGRC